MLPKVAIVVLTWNNFTDTDECLDSLTALDYPHYEVVVVDNGSTDDSLSRLRRKWADHVEFVSLTRNRGVAGGYNAGIRYALERGAAFIQVLNNDVVVHPDLLKVLLAVYDSEERVAVTGPLVVYYADRGRLWYGGGVYNRWLGYTRHCGLGRPVPAWGRRQPPVTWRTDYVVGCCMLISRTALVEVGLFDERYFLYLEDVDWCLRAKRQGYVCRVVACPLVAHKVSASAGVRGSTLPGGIGAYYMARNSFLLARKHLLGWQAPVFLFGQLCLRLPRYTLGMALAQRWPSVLAYLHGTRDGLRLWFAAPRGA